MYLYGKVIIIGLENSLTVASDLSPKCLKGTRSSNDNYHESDNEREKQNVCLRDRQGVGIGEGNGGHWW